MSVNTIATVTVNGEEKIITDEKLEQLKKLNGIHVSWRDYALMLLNSTAEPLASIWHEKLLTSYAHWKFNDGSISEVNVNGMEIMSELPSEFTEMVVDDHYMPESSSSWEKVGRLSGSKRMKVHIGGYPQESLSNEAYLCVKYLCQHWNEQISTETAFRYAEDLHKKGIMLVHDDPSNVKYSDVFMSSPTLRKMLKLAQMADGIFVTQDEVLTYILEKPITDHMHGVWMIPFVDVFMNGIPSQKYEKYWKSKQFEGFPKNCAEEKKEKVDEILQSIEWNSENENYSINDVVEKINQAIEEYETDLPFETQMENLNLFCQKYVLTEDVSYSPCWKKICICVLKNDVSFKYCGFGATLRERQARENAMAAFSTKQEEKKKAKEEAMRLAEQMKKEKDNEN